MRSAPFSRMTVIRTNLQTTLAAGAAMLAATAGLGFVPAAAAQGVGQQQRQQPQQQRIAVVPERQTLLRLMQPITLNIEENRLEDVLNFIGSVTGAEIEPMWLGDRSAEGLDRDAPVTLRLRELPALTVLERVLTYVEDDFGGGNTWQMSEDTGAIQVGPRSRLNRYKRTVIYDINDLLMDIPDRDEVPDIDLQNVLQGQQGGGGGQSPFRQDQQERERDRATLADRAAEIEDLIVDLVHPEQWQRNGGDGAFMRHFRGTLIVRGADYIHREINGYPYWPAGVRVSRTPSGSRWVSLNMDTGISTIDEMATRPVSAVVGGQVISSDPGGGG